MGSLTFGNIELKCIMQGVGKGKGNMVKGKHYRGFLIRRSKERKWQRHLGLASKHFFTLERSERIFTGIF